MRHLVSGLLLAVLGIGMSCPAEGQSADAYRIFANSIRVDRASH